MGIIFVLSVIAHLALFGTELETMPLHTSNTPVFVKLRRLDDIFLMGEVKIKAIKEKHI